MQEALHQLEVLFDCTGEADFQLAVKLPGHPWCHLATRRWRLALYFISSQYERAFARNAFTGALGQAADRLATGPVSVSALSRGGDSAFVSDTGVVATESALMRAAGDPDEPAR
jgi:hypothetical protein